MQPQTPSLVTRILELYRLTPARVHDPQKGYRNTSYAIDFDHGDTLNLILYKREPGILYRIHHAGEFGAALHRAGFPVRHPAHSRLIRLAGPGTVRYAALYNYLPGVTIPWESYTRDHLKLIGVALSDIHATPVTLPDLPTVTDEMLQLIERMRRYFLAPHVAGAAAHKLRLHVRSATLDQFERTIRACRRLPGARPLHLDFVRSNLLFGSALDYPAARFRLGDVALTGIIDFEKAALGHPAFDIARTLAFLLVDCKYKTRRQVYKYFLYSGYAKRGAAPFHRSWLKLINRLVDLYLLHDFYKFLRHNPYEHLAENEHYVRTRDLLLERHLIESLEVSDAVTGDPQ